MRRYFKLATLCLIPFLPIRAYAQTGTIEIRTLQENNTIKVEFSDSGKGISKNRLKNIFDFSLRDRGSRIKMSSGISAAYNIIQKHHGEPKIESEEGRGARVIVLLPVNQPRIQPQYREKSNAIS